MKQVTKENVRWITVVEDFEINPADGIRGGVLRRRKWRKVDEKTSRHFLPILTELNLWIT